MMDSDTFRSLDVFSRYKRRAVWCFIIIRHIFMEAMYESALRDALAAGKRGFLGEIVYRNFGRFFLMARIFLYLKGRQGEGRERC